MTRIKPKNDLSSEFDPRMLVEDARIQAPEFIWLPAALSSCGPGKWESRAYVRYTSPSNPNQPDSQWQFETNVVIDHAILGIVAIDILQGNRIGGIEFMDRLDC